MSSISLSMINATNATFTLPIGRYIDFNIWIIFLAFALIFILASRFISSREELGRLIVSIIAFVSMIVTTYGSLGLAHISSAEGVSVLLHNDTSVSYVYPVITPLAAPWLTAVCVVLLILAFLNVLDIFLTMMQKPTANDLEKKSGRGVKI